MSCLMFTPCTAESSTSWRIASETGETSNCPMLLELYAHMLTLRRNYLPHLSLFHQMVTLKQHRKHCMQPGDGCMLLLLRHLTSVSPFREESQRIADVFLSRKAEFLVFTTYIGHYDRSMSLLEDSCRTSPAFAAIVHQFEVRPTVILTFKLKCTM